MDLEYPLVRVPYERLSNVFKNSTKSIEKDIGLIIQSVQQLAKKKDVKKSEGLVLLEKFSQRLELLKKKLDEVSRQEELFLESCKMRYKYLAKCKDIESHSRAATDDSAELLWHESRLNRILIDHMLRFDRYETATLLAKEYKLNEYVEIELFTSKAKKIVEALRKHDVQEALRWAATNKARLKKMGKLALEAELRIQEFVTLLKVKRTLEAVQYAREHLHQFLQEGGDIPTRVNKALPMLVFAFEPDSQLYREYLSESRWYGLISLFKESFYEMYGIPSESLLNLTLELGLSCFKTTLCGTEEHHNSDCPTCSTVGSELAESLPYAHHAHSSLVCFITKKIMDEENYPLVLPNGNAYSREAMEDMALHQDGKVICPRTNEEFLFSQLRRAFIM